MNQVIWKQIFAEAHGQIGAKTVNNCHTKLKITGSTTASQVVHISNTPPSHGCMLLISDSS